MLVFILLYNIGTENEGIHTVQVGNHNTVLMFESGVGATYYSLMLENFGFPKPLPSIRDEILVKEFCQDYGYSFEFVSNHHVAIPPKSHVSFGEKSKFSEKSLNKLDSNQKQHYLESLKETYFLYKRNIADLQQKEAIYGSSPYINRQIEYYYGKIDGIKIEIEQWV